MRTYEWDCPEAIHNEAQSQAGIDFLNNAMVGENHRPPMAHTMDFYLSEVSEGKAAFLSTPSEFHYNPFGSVHGGYFGVLLDSAMGCAVHSTLAKGESCTTLEYKINLVRGLTSDIGEVRTEGWIVHRGNRVATAEGKIIDSNGKIYAHGSTTCLILSNGGSGQNPKKEG